MPLCQRLQNFTRRRQMARVLFITFERGPIAKDNHHSDIERLLDARARDWHPGAGIDPDDAANFAKSFRRPNQYLLVCKIAWPFLPDENNV